MAENDPEEMQKRVRYTDIVANVLMLQNVADVTATLEQLRQQSYPVQPEDVVYLSAYMTEHLQRFGLLFLLVFPMSYFARISALGPSGIVEKWTQFSSPPLNKGAGGSRP